MDKRVPAGQQRAVEGQHGAARGAVGSVCHFGKSALPHDVAHIGVVLAFKHRIKAGKAGEPVARGGGTIRQARNGERDGAIHIENVDHLFAGLDRHFIGQAEERAAIFAGKAFFQRDAGLAIVFGGIGVECFKNTQLVNEGKSLLSAQVHGINPCKVAGCGSLCCRCPYGTEAPANKLTKRRYCATMEWSWINPVELTCRQARCARQTIVKKGLFALAAASAAGFGTSILIWPGLAGVGLTGAGGAAGFASSAWGTVSKGFCCFLAGGVAGAGGA